MLEDDPDTARSYLFYRWYSEWMETVREEREAKGLTQQDIASTLDTTHSSIARLENDRRGGITIRRLWEYAFAVGVSPLVEFRPSSGLMSFVKQQPDAQLRARPYDAWTSPEVERLSPLASATQARHTYARALALHNSVLGTTASQWKLTIGQINSFAAESAKMMEGLQSTFATLWKATAVIAPTEGPNNLHLDKRAVGIPETFESKSSTSVDMQKLAA
jgi:transcriptional regulator with XRE-family HTH domain